MTNVAFIVDGDLEKKFLFEACKGATIRKIGNGDDFPVHVIAKHVMSHVRLLSNRIRHFIILLDLEDRNLTPKQFSESIRAALIAAGMGNQNFSIVIKEREVEDWILADSQSISEYVGNTVCTLGLKGKGGLSQILKQNNIKYNEVAIGSELLKSVFYSRAALRSPSLAFLKKAFPGNCWWLNR